MRFVTHLYDQLEKLWHNPQADKWVSRGLIGGFTIGLFLVMLSKVFDFPALPIDANYFLAIDIAFQTLLIIEYTGLIFVLPRSVADSVGKQFEILSVILLGALFKFRRNNPNLR